MNEKQQYAYDKVLEGDNVFISGSGGTGKSWILSEIRKWAIQNHVKLQITSTSGASAILCGGRTINSFLGIGLATKSAKALYEDVCCKQPHLIKTLQMLDILAIDEISMMSAELFDKISEFLKLIRKNNKPFGEIQLILLGDFCQLPPINGKYCFKADTWKLLNMETIMLTQIMRQNNEEFIFILEELRFGRCNSDIRRRLRLLRDTEFPDDGIKPTILYCKNVDVDAINNHEYNLLLADNPIRREYKTTYASHIIKNWAKSVPEIVDLCVGAQVMVTWNINVAMEIANGSRGVIMELNKSSVNIKLVNGNTVNIPYVTIPMDDTQKHLTCTFMPLRLAWATTIHKSQGATLDRIIINIEDAFDYGQSYVAISRARNISDIKIIGAIKSSFFKCSNEVLDFYGI